MLPLKQCWSFTSNHAVRPGVKRNTLAPASVHVKADAGHADDGHHDGCQSTRHMVNSSHGQLVTGQLATRSTRHAVDLSQAKASKHQSRTAVAVITLSLRSPTLLKNCPSK